MTLVLGTNCGFVTTAPTADPAGGSSTWLQTYSFVTKALSPATAIKITEIGFWVSEATEEANFEVGLYAADGATVPGEAGTLLQVSRTNAKGTTAGWKTVTVDWSISPSTNYWLGVQLDDTSTTRIDLEYFVGIGLDYLASQTTLSNPYGGGAIWQTNAVISLYAVWEAAPPTGTNMQINIGDGLNVFYTEYFGCWLSVSIIFSIIEILKHIG